MNTRANKVYIKNCSTTAAEYFTVHIDQEEIGRLYGGGGGIPFIFISF